ncbi:MAG: Asp-tRNA(Asn)/Glu-tRNA(Gln) amidotransferase subunit GatB [Candidatus Portnoybacteria bacterium]|nr:Asp-tRNA(Asn)/Glu-tRNA(Gln) amidotransferase subunit GatB [Candidatus Portnoybacteria bacterium]
MAYTPTIGLEIHAQLNTKTKLFCSDKNDPDQAAPNANICPVCMGHPGTLPVLNQEAVKKIVQAGIALGCTINQFSKFDRKNYFYPDLPKGYQISQYDIPFCVSGKFRLSSEKEIRIRRIHLEEDTGRLIHQAPTNDKRPTTNDSRKSLVASRESSYIDFNRAGVPLMELVTQPDFTSSDEVLEFVKKIQLLWRYLGISDADMEKGQMRVEVNISLFASNFQFPISNFQINSKFHFAAEGGSAAQAEFPNSKLGTKVEVKNLNSFKAVEQAIAYEIKRQAGLLDKGEKVAQETRGWDPVKGETFLQREKETEKDYRYFPEPDLPPVILRDDELELWQRTIPELPWERKTRFIQEYKLPLQDADILVEQKETGEYFEEAASELMRWEQDIERKEVTREHMPRLLKLAANYLITEFPRITDEIYDLRFKIYERITPENFAELIILTHSGKISSSAAQAVLLEMSKTGNDPHAIIEEKGLAQVSDTSELEAVVKEAIAENEKAVNDYKKGKAGALQFLVGKAMAKSKGKANPHVVQNLLQKFLAD